MCQVGITVALRQAVMAVSVRGFLWGLVLSSLAQLAHSLWLLLLLLLAADAADTPAVMVEPAVGSRARGPVASTKVQALRARAQGCVDPEARRDGLLQDGPPLALRAARRRFQPWRRPLPGECERAEITPTHS
ncbi:hypothetical protein MTO96_019081 [Rhipicephalus appendiculatus]